MELIAEIITADLWVDQSLACGFVSLKRAKLQNVIADTVRDALLQIPVGVYKVKEIDFSTANPYSWKIKISRSVTFWYNDDEILKKKIKFSKISTRV